MPKQSLDCPKQHKDMYDQSRNFHCDSQEPSHDSLTKVPTIDDFVFIKPISRGAFGKVFLGQKKGNLDKLYAIKAMKKSDMVNKNLVGQVVIERDAMAKLSSPFVVQLYYSIQTHHNIFLVMEYLIGGDLKSLLGVAGCFEEPMAIMYVAEVTLALEYLHNKHIIHRDLKPDNMLLTDKGHIKLTDFGLSKFNMHFSAHDVSMTPKTPLPYSKVDLDYYRTPGQILSLRSSLAFSAETYASHKKLTPQSPLAEDSYMTSEKVPLGAAHMTTTPKLQNQKCVKQKTMRDVMLTNSASKKYVTQHIMSTPGKQEVLKSAPVASLRTTLEASLDWKISTQSESTENASFINVSDLSSIVPVNRPIGLSFSCQDNIDNIYSVHSIMSSDGICKNFNRGSIGEDISDSVFESVNMMDPELDFSVDNSLFKFANIRVCTCQNTLEHDLKLCSECTSHLKAPSRQEKLTDDTPQMHRTEESVLNSYAAQNLRSLRHGWNSLGSEHDSSTKENVDHSCYDKKEEVHCDKSRHLKKRRLVKAKSFCYPSDEDTQTFKNRYGEIRLAHKRSFHHVELSPVRRAHSAGSGLTQEFQFLQCDFPASKRSNTLPRTRIRFPSASETENKNEMVSKAIASESNSFISHNDYKKDVYIDKMDFCAGEQILVQNQDNTSKFELEKTHVPCTAEISNQTYTCNNECSVSGQQQNIVDKNGQESMSFEHHDIVYSMHDYDHNASNTKRLPLDTCNLHLQKPVTSCLRSEDAVHGRLRLSWSLDDDKENDDGDVMSYKSSSVTVTSSQESPESMEVHRSISPAEKTTVFSLTQQKQPLLLIPCPPPKMRESSGKNTPVKTHFTSVTSCIPPYVDDDIRNKSNIHMSDALEPVQNEVLLPKPRMPEHSFAFTTKTPYRTPKSVRRAQVHSEEERILGTPDYLAPEILQQKPHGPAVDWWSLGICMFEFLTGEPPFNDQTPELVFTNILNRDIPWPEGDEALSKECREAIELLLTMDPEKRPKARDVRKMDAFGNIDWHTVLEKEAPWLPQPDNDMDTNYFEVRNMIQGLFVSDVDF